MEGMQWPPLMEALKSNGNYDVGHLRITAIKSAENDGECLLYSRRTGRRLSAYARSVGIPFSFQRTGRTVSCGRDYNIHLHVTIASHVQSARQNASSSPHATFFTGPHGAERERADFVESFCRCLQNLWAIFDSLEAGSPQHGLARAMVERRFFGPAMSRRMVSNTAYSPPHTRKSNLLDLALECSYSAGSIINLSSVVTRR